ncbi:MAG: GerMN domain-containing protein [bacterium]
MKSTGRLLLTLAFIGLSGIAALYYADPLMDLIRKGEVAAPGAAGGEASGLAAPLKVELVFASAREEGLIRYPAEVERGDNVAQNLRRVLEALFSGPKRPGYAPIVPPGTKLRAVFPDPRGIAYVDLDRTVRDAHPGGAWAELLTVYGVANTVLLNFGDIFERVVILIDGQEAETIAGSLTINGPLRLREDLILASAPEPAEAPPAPPRPPTPAGVPRAPVSPVGEPGAGTAGAPSGEPPPPGRR